VKNVRRHTYDCCLINYLILNNRIFYSEFISFKWNIKHNYCTTTNKTVGKKQYFVYFIPNHETLKIKIYIPLFICTAMKRYGSRKTQMCPGGRGIGPSLSGWKVGQGVGAGCTRALSSMLIGASGVATNTRINCATNPLELLKDTCHSEVNNQTHL